MKIFKKIAETGDNRLRQFCDRLTNGQKFIIVVIITGIFIIASLCIFFDAAYNIGKSDGKLMQLEHLQPAPVLTPNIKNYEVD